MLELAYFNEKFFKISFCVCLDNTFITCIFLLLIQVKVVSQSETIKKKKI